MQIIKCAKDLLSSLYDKVVLSRTEEPLQDPEEVVKMPIQPKEYVIPLEEPVRVEKLPENPNYVGQEHVRKVAEPTLKEERGPMIEFLGTFLMKKIKK